MASVYVSIGTPAPSGTPVLRGQVRSEIITSSGTAASGALTAGPNDVARIHCATAVYASVSGTASASNGHYVPAGVVVELGLPSGGTVSVIDA